MTYCITVYCLLLVVISMFCCITGVLVFSFIPLVTQLVHPEISASSHVWNRVYIALGYTVNDAPLLSPLKSPTTLAAAPEQDERPS